MELERIRCLNCGADLDSYDPKAEVVQCPRIGCGAMFLVPRAREFARVQVDHAQEIAILRRLLDEALQAEDALLMEQRAQEIRRLIPEDALAIYCEVLGQKKRGIRRGKAYREYLAAAGEMSEWEAERILDIALSEKTFTPHDEEPLKAFIRSKFPSQRMDELSRRLDHTIRRKYELENCYANVPRDVFICHCSVDLVSLEVFDMLTDDGVRCWISQRNLPEDTRYYWPVIEQALRQCKIILVIATRACMISEDAKREMELAEELGLQRLELKADDTVHTVFFRHFFDGIQWVKLGGNTREDKRKAFEELKERVFELLHGEERGSGLPVRPSFPTPRSVPDPAPHLLPRIVPAPGVDPPLTRAGQFMEEGDREGALLHGRERGAELPDRPPFPATHAVTEAAPDPLPRTVPTPGVDALLTRAGLFMEDGDWASALAYVEKALDGAPKHAPAYIARLMARMKVSNEKALARSEEPLTDDPDFQKALRFASSAEKRAYEEYEQENTYLAAMRHKALGGSQNFITAEWMFKRISGYRDAAQQSSECREQAKRIRLREQEAALQHQAWVAQERKKSEINREQERLEAQRLEAERKAGAEQEQLEQEMKREQERLEAMRKAREEVRLELERKARAEQERLEQQRKCEQFIAGSIVTFGRYAQDDYTGNGKEPIRWWVLKREGNKALLISDQNLDCQPYNAEWTSITWEKCSLRNWLNRTFLTAAFTPEERKAIHLTALDNREKHNHYGPDTEDRVFLLNLEEAKTLFRDDSDRKAANTPFAKAQGASDAGGFGWWWLRTPGYGSFNASNVLSSGSVQKNGPGVHAKCGAVRPALWINLDSGIFSSSQSALAGV